MLLLNLLGLLGWEIQCLKARSTNHFPPSTSPLKSSSEILRNLTFALALSCSLYLAFAFYHSILLAIALALSCSIW